MVFSKFNCANAKFVCDKLLAARFFPDNPVCGITERLLPAIPACGATGAN